MESENATIKGDNATIKETLTVVRRDLDEVRFQLLARQLMLALERRFLAHTFGWESPWASRTFKQAMKSFENESPAASSSRTAFST